MAKAPSKPVSTPQAVPMMKAARRPWARETAPVGKVPPASPSTYIEIGTVASETSGAKVAPTIEPVAKITAEFAPVSACAAARRATLARMRASLDASSAAVRSVIGYFHSRAAGSVYYEGRQAPDQPTLTGARYASPFSLFRLDRTPQ